MLAMLRPLRVTVGDDGVQWCSSRSSMRTVVVCSGRAHACSGMGALVPDELVAAGRAVLWFAISPATYAQVVTRQRWLTNAAVFAALGGALWIVKLAFVAAAGGGENAAIATCYLGGWAFMCVGSTWVGTRLALHRPVVVLAILVVLSLLLVFVSYTVIDAVAQPSLGQLGPAWFEAEAGILVTGLVWFLLGLAALRWSRLARSRAKQT